LAPQFAAAGDVALKMAQLAVVNVAQAQLGTSRTVAPTPLTFQKRQEGMDSCMTYHPKTYIVHLSLSFASKLEAQLIYRNVHQIGDVVT
jgi:hypothetical protein